MRGDSDVAGEVRVAGIPKFHSWGKYTMPLTNINPDWMSNASSGLCIIYSYYIIYTSKVTAPQDCSQVSAAGLPRLEHFRVQCYTQVKSLLVGFGENTT